MISFFSGTPENNDESVNPLLISLESAYKEIPKQELIRILNKHDVQTYKYDGDFCLSKQAWRFWKKCYQENKNNMPHSRSKTLSLLDEMLINKEERSLKLRISPSDAKEILEHYHIPHNRNISRNLVSRYVNCMKRGEWGLSESIKFNINGQLCDGQHRLTAVIVSDCSLDFFVQGGYLPGDMGNIDRGKNRRLVDIAVIDGHNWFNNEFFAIFNHLFHPLDSKKLGKMSDAQKIDCVSQVKEGIEFALKNRHSNGKKIYCASFCAVVARAYYADKKIPKELLNNFMAYAHGYNPLSSPEFFAKEYLEYPPAIILRLRDFYVAKEITKYTTDTGRGAYEIKYFMVQYALNKFIKKEKVSSLRLRFEDGNLFPSKLIDSMLDF
jgi:hypothetical protein